MASALGCPVDTQGTVVPVDGFDAESDAQVLRKAMKGMGTNEKAIIKVVSKRSNKQLLEIMQKYKVLFGKDLIEDLKSELGGNFENLVVSLFVPCVDFKANSLRRAMKGVGTDEEALIEIIVPQSNEQMQEVVAKFKELFGRDLEKDIDSELSGDFKRLLISLCQGARDQVTEVDEAKAEKEAQDLYDAGEGQWGTDESRFNQVLALRSFPQLRATFEQYRKLAKRDIVSAIDKEMSGDLKQSMQAVVKVVENTPLFYAERIYRSMKGAGTDDDTLIRIIVSRCEIDMVQINDEFMKTYKKSIGTMIKSDCSGDYEKLLLALVGED
ncbi:Annexin A7-like [Oopsacas minuta]|uniref:Annexin n=1 Tax=Oopsacas minuta TaxID=111878 RepID=A0AAV7K0S3_9METZ|nr:Annexin A7-like [Oopsacas minuta]